MRVRTRPLSHTASSKAEDGASASAQSGLRIGSSSARRGSRIGLRAEQAARERTIALRVISLLSILAVATVVLGAAAGWATPLFKTLSDASAGIRGSRVANPVASTSLRAALGIASGNDSATQSGSSASMKPIRSTSVAVASAKSATQSGLQTSARSDKKVVASTKSAVSRAVVSQSTALINPIAKPTPSPAALPAASAVPPAPGTVTIETFGYSFGDAPPDCRFVADVRNIDAGTFSQNESGLMPSVRDRVMATNAAKAWLNVFRTQWMPALKDGDKVAIGCSKGHHRSVTLGVIFADDLRAQGFTVNLVHRDIDKTY